MKCTACQSERSMCIDSRRCSIGRRRRRHCCICGQRYTTYEVLASDIEKIRTAVGRPVLPEESQREVLGLIHRLSELLAQDAPSTLAVTNAKGLPKRKFYFDGRSEVAKLKKPVDLPSPES